MMRRPPRALFTASDSIRGRSLSQPTLTASDTADSSSRAALMSAVPELSAVAVGELDSIVGVLTAKFPGYARAHHVRNAVYETHRRLAAAARIQTHLIPLTLNRGRFHLEDASALSSADRL
jgi:hypothetical protein